RLNPFSAARTLRGMSHPHSTRPARAIGPSELARVQHEVQLIDCRSPGEFASGHIPRSLNIPVDELGSRLHDIDPARPAVFVCASGTRARAAATLVPDGTPVAVLDGGLAAWTKSHGA